MVSPSSIPPCRTLAKLPQKSPCALPVSPTRSASEHCLIPLPMPALPHQASRRNPCSSDACEHSETSAVAKRPQMQGSSPSANSGDEEAQQKSLGDVTMGDGVERKLHPI